MSGDGRFSKNSQPRKRNLKRLLINLLLGFLSIVATFVVVELYLMISNYEYTYSSRRWLTDYDEARDNREVRFQLDPLLIFTNKKIFEKETDEYGFRYNSDHSNEADYANTIIVIGDSFTYGGGPTPPEESYPFFLERLLHQEGYDSIVHNAAISGTGMDVQLLNFEWNILPLGLRPSIVIWNLYINDLDDGYMHPVYFLYKNKLVYLPGWFNGTYLAGKFVRMIPPWFRTLRVVNLIAFSLQQFSVLNLPIIGVQDKRGWVVEKMKKEIQYMYQLAEKHDFHLLIVLGPNQGYLAQQADKIQMVELMRHVIQEASETLDMHAYLQDNRFALSITPPGPDSILGIQTLPVDEYFYDEGQEPWPPYGWKHLNEQGNQLTAQAIYQQLKEADWLR